MSEYKAPDLSAPRFRGKTTIILNRKLHKAFLEKYPKHEGIDLKAFKEVVTTYNGLLWQGAIDNRDGIQLPESLGYLLITKCDRPKTNNMDYIESAKLGKKVNHSNWGSENYLAKICYSNYSLKYRFTDRELWSFSAGKSFRSGVSGSFPELYNNYIHLTDKTKLSRLYKGV